LLVWMLLFVCSRSYLRVGPLYQYEREKIVSPNLKGGKRKIGVLF
jgi:hypothetical protein